MAEVLFGIFGCRRDGLYFIGLQRTAASSETLAICSPAKSALTEIFSWKTEEHFGRFVMSGVENDSHSVNDRFLDDVWRSGFIW